MKTYIHGFLDTVIVIAVSTENGSQTVIVKRPNGQIIHMTEDDIACADYYLLDDDDDTRTDVEDDTQTDVDDDENTLLYLDEVFVVF